MSREQEPEEIESPNHSIRMIVLVLAAWFVIHLVYLILLSPWELLGDEAYYWVQSQHLSLSYAEKGPLLAWILAGFCRIFGNHEWVVRLPMLISSVLSAGVVGAVSRRFTGGKSFATLISVLLFLLIPAFQANAQICTQDGILILFQILLVGIGLRLIRSIETREVDWSGWLMFYAVMGVGILLKQSILLFLTAFVIYWIFRFKQVRWTIGLFMAQCLGAIVMAVICLPIVIWESRNGWPLLNHTMGHLGIGGDQAGHKTHGNQLVWIGSTLVSIFGSFGPALVIMSLASIRAWKNRHIEPDRWPARLWMMATAWPGVLFFVGLGFFKEVVPSWPLPLLVGLVPLSAEYLDDLYHSLGLMWNSFLCRSMLIYGVVAGLLIADPMILRHLPFFGKKIDKSVLARFSGQRQHAQNVVTAQKQFPDADFFVAPHYQLASLMRFYLPPESQVTCAGSYVSNRFSNYDVWPDTNLKNNQLIGRNIFLINGDMDRWTNGLVFERIIPLGDSMYLGQNFKGVRTQANANAASVEGSLE